MRLAPKGKKGWLKALARIGSLFGVALLAIYGYGLWVTTMPGESLAGPLPAQTAAEVQAEARVKAAVYKLASEIGPRDRAEFPQNLEKAADYVQNELRAAGYTVKALPYKGSTGEVFNYEAILEGTGESKEVIVVVDHGTRRPVPYAGCGRAHYGRYGHVTRLPLDNQARGLGTGRHRFGPPRGRQQQRLPPVQPWSPSSWYLQRLTDSGRLLSLRLWRVGQASGFAQRGPAIEACTQELMI